MKVVMIAVGTICGRISPATMGSVLDRRRLENARAETDASLMGAGTLRAGNPEMRGPGGTLFAKRLRAIISESGQVPVKNRKLFDEGAKPIIFTGEDQKSNLIGRLGRKAEVISIPKNAYGLSVSAAIDELECRGATSVLVEGGSILNYASLKEGVIDEILLTFTPFLSGDSDAVTLAGGPGSLGDPFLALELIESNAAETGEIFCRYKIKK